MKENVSTELIGKFEEFKNETIRQLDRYMHFLTHNFIQNNLEMFKRMGLGEEDLKQLEAWGCISKLLDRGKLTELELQGLEDDFDDEEEDDEDEDEDEEDDEEEDEDEDQEIDEYDDADVDVTGEN